MCSIKYIIKAYAGGAPAFVVQRNCIYVGTWLILTLSSYILLAHFVTLQLRKALQ